MGFRRPGVGAARRPNFRGYGLTAVPPNPTAYGITNFISTNVIRTATTNAGLVGTGNTPFWREIVVRIDSQAISAGSRFLASYFTGGTGWRFITTGTNNGILFDMIDATVAVRVATTFVVTPAMLGKLIHLYGYWDGTSVRMTANGVTTGTGTLTGTFLAPTNTAVTCIGQRSNGTAIADGSTIFGLRGGDGVKSDADGLAAYNAWKATSRFATAGAAKVWDVGTTHSAGLTTTWPELVAGAAGDAFGFASGVTSPHTLQTVVNPEYA